MAQHNVACTAWHGTALPGEAAEQEGAEGGGSREGAADGADVGERCQLGWAQGARWDLPGVRREGVSQDRSHSRTHPLGKSGGPLQNHPLLQDTPHTPRTPTYSLYPHIQPVPPDPPGRRKKDGGKGKGGRWKKMEGGKEGGSRKDGRRKEHGVGGRRKEEEGRRKGGYGPAGRRSR